MNAGKSTLFNALVKARAYAADQLFATLDTTTRQLYLGEASRSVSLSDTVGFIRDLPHTLVAAFRATLEETVQADLLLHVVDSASPARERQIDEVNLVLDEIGADAIPQLMVWNKTDLRDLPATIERDEHNNIVGVRVSALTGEGLPLLRDALATLPPDAYVLLTEALKLAQHAEMLEIWGIMHLARQFAACVNQHANELDSVTARAALDDMLDKLSAGIDAVAV